MTALSVTKKERIVSMDILRGIALMGILLVNAPAYMTYIEGQSIIQHAFDPTLRLLYDLFITTKFFSIFSFLFGLGFYIFMSRAEARGDKPFILFVRRLAALLLFGILHIVTWFGDILFYYAILGFALIPFYRRSAKTILIWSMGLFAVTVLASGIAAVQTYLGSPVPEFIRSFKSDTFAILGMFLLGLYVGKQNIVAEVDKHVHLLKRTQLITFVLSIIPFVGILWCHFTDNPLQEILQPFFSRMDTYPMALLYMSSLFLLLRNERVATMLKPFANYGRLGLTSYFTQNIIGSVIISLFGWSNGYTLVQSFYMAMIILVVQLIISNLYFLKFKQGPLEFIWRKLTYGFKRKDKATA
ncbi:DUF418 domain-containing protein [Brevibacillus laterosporus]|uniref:DUF418 domain-containing protein n=1 Tax=Brevibacillus halotolerans TaxID=1507437 RepID=A0ABT4I333_9BACL|nr:MULTISPECIES: DUF418 domain-containing protein [Brevibacillus]MCR8987143.1 DUF418 domain-containing protein [Brevibacillus laterosporus]MCZ0832880.1 DUF418 domain-containing protein [Brevibacillus halotolerans]OAJ73913.1 hypothetical protein AYJ08_11870 [Brevibacillus sp. SKDU10]